MKEIIIICNDHTCVLRNFCSNFIGADLVFFAGFHQDFDMDGKNSLKIVNHFVSMRGKFEDRFPHIDIKLAGFIFPHGFAILIKFSALQEVCSWLQAHKFLANEIYHIKRDVVFFFNEAERVERKFVLGMARWEKENSQFFIFKVWTEDFAEKRSKRCRGFSKSCWCMNKGVFAFLDCFQHTGNHITLFIADLIIREEDRRRIENVCFGRHSSAFVGVYKKFLVFSRSYRLTILLTHHLNLYKFVLFAGTHGKTCNHRRFWHSRLSSISRCSMDKIRSEEHTSELQS